MAAPDNFLRSNKPMYFAPNVPVIDFSSFVATHNPAYDILTTLNRASHILPIALPILAARRALHSHPARQALSMGLPVVPLAVLQAPLQLVPLSSR